jgi:hypothetical protein
MQHQRCNTGASEIHPQACVTHVPTRGCWKAVVQTVDESGGPQEHGRRAYGWRWLPEMHISDFEKIKTKNFRNRV